MTGVSARENGAQAQFASLMGQLDQPVYVVTVRGADGPAGCLVGFAGQVSMIRRYFSQDCPRRTTPGVLRSRQVTWQCI